MARVSVLKPSFVNSAAPGPRDELRNGPNGSTETIRTDFAVYSWVQNSLVHEIFVVERTMIAIN
jgi:hypothetical protein